MRALRFSSSQQRVVASTILSLALESSYMRIVFTNVELARCLIDRVFGLKSVLEHGLVISELLLEV